MNENKLVYRSINEDDKGYYLRVEIIEKDSVAILAEGQLHTLICKDLLDGQLFAISPAAFENSFKVEKHTKDEPENNKDSDTDMLMKEIMNMLERLKKV